LLFRGMLVRRFEIPLTLPSPARGEGFKPLSLDGRGWGRVKLRVTEHAMKINFFSY
jgi:hypothetical protein